MGVGAAIAGGAALSAGAGIAGSSMAAGAQSKAAGQSAQIQVAQMNNNLARADPFITTGQIAAQQLPGAIATPMDLSGQPTVKDMPTPPAQFQWNPTLAGLQQTPGYQFQLQQGLQAQQNAATARGLGVSGAQLRGAADYAEGLAGTTYNQQLQNAIATNQQQLAGYSQQLAGFTAGQGAYQNQFNDYWNNQLYKSNQLQNIAQLGGNVAVGAGSNLAQQASNVGNAVQAQGAAQAAGIMGQTNALTSGINNISSLPLANQLLNGALFSGGSTIGGPAISGTNTQSLIPATSDMTAYPTNYYAGGSSGPGY